MLKHDAPAVLEQCLVEFRFAGRERRRVDPGLEFEKRVLAAQVVDPQVAFDRQAEYGARHGFVVVVHLPDVAQRSGRKFPGRLVACNENTFLRILAVAAPDRHRIGNYADESGEQDYQAHVVLQNPGGAIQRCGLGHQAFGPHHDDRESVKGPERRVGLEVRYSIGIDARREVLAIAAVRAGVALRRNTACRHIEVEAHRCAAVINRERPVEAGDVPVEFVMLFEETEHPGCAVAEMIGVYAVIDESVAAAKVSAYAIPVFHDLERLARVITEHREGLKIHHVAVAELVEILGGKVAVDPPAYAITLRTDTDRLRHLYPAVLLDRDVAVELEDALVGARQQREYQQYEPGEPAHSTDPILTSGTFAASSAVFWKNSRGLNRNTPATRLLGTVSVIVL